MIGMRSDMGASNLLYSMEYQAGKYPSLLPMALAASRQVSYERSRHLGLVGANPILFDQFILKRMG